MKGTGSYNKHEYLFLTNNFEYFSKIFPPFGRLRHHSSHLQIIFFPYLTDGRKFCDPGTGRRWMRLHCINLRYMYTVYLYICMCISRRQLVEENDSGAAYLFFTTKLRVAQRTNWGTVSSCASSSPLISQSIVLCVFSSWDPPHLTTTTIG